MYYNLVQLLKFIAKPHSLKENFKLSNSYAHKRNVLDASRELVTTDAQYKVLPEAQCTQTSRAKCDTEPFLFDLSFCMGTSSKGTLSCLGSLILEVLFIPV